MNKNSAAQDAAIRHRDGPALIIAGPGSGKTYTIVRRLENLIINCQIRPSEILTITYTKEAAREMRSRAFSLVGECAKEAAFGTFHSVFYSILRNTFSLNASNILKRRDKYLILRDIAGKLNLETSDIPSVVTELSTLISRSKNGMDTKSALGEEIDRKAVTLYNEALKELRLIDFDDMIIKCRSLFERDPVCLKKWQERYRYIMVDEFQDTDPAQYDTIRLLAGERANLCVVGDDDQAIFGFRGADPQVLQRFLEDYPDAVKYELDINYRCHAPIADAADKVIEENSRRIKKHHSAFNLMGYKVDIRCFKDREKETDGIRKEINTDILGSYAVLTRTNEMAGFFAEELEKRGVPVCLSGRKRSIYDSDVAKDVIAYIRLASGVYAREDILRVVNKPMRFISREAYATSKADIKDALIFYRDRENILKQAERFAGDVEIMGRMSPRAALRYLMKVAGYESFLKSEGRSTRELYELYGIAGSYTSLKQWLKAIADSTFTDDNTDNAGNRERVVSVMTLHSSKGLEFDEVFIPDVNEGIIPCRRAVLTEDTEEERRLFYVGMTRAVKKLHIYYLNESCGKEMQPSVFLKPLL